MSLNLDRLKEFDSRQLNQLGPLCLLILILYLMWKLAALFWLLVAPTQPMQVERVELGSKQAQIPNISSFSLFQEQASPSAVSNLTDMILQGVMIATPSQYSSAVIKYKDSSDRFRVGEALGDTGYELAEVYWDRVVLRQRSGATQTLNFKGLEHGLNQPYSQNNSNRSAFNAPETTESAPQEQTNSPQNEISRAIQQMNENRDQYMQNMGVSASSEGYEVSARTPAILRNRLGLRPGDRILSLNGRTMGNGQSETQLLEQARREGQVKLEIKRGDQVMTIQQDLK